MSNALAAPLRALLALRAIGAAVGHADYGPHPTNRFELVWQTTPVAVIETRLLDCGDRACAKPVRTSFSSGARFLRLVITFEDRVRTSGVFEKHGYTTVFQVRVNPDDLEVAIVAKTLSWKLALMTANFFNALLITLGIEYPTVVLLLWRWKIAYRMGTIVYANLLTLPILWVLTSLWMSDTTFASVAFLETLVTVAEAVYYCMRMRNGGLTWLRAFVTSASANGASVAIPFVWALVPLLPQYA